MGGGLQAVGASKEIEVTSEMVEAGIRVLISGLGGDRYQGHDRELVTKVFSAMLQEYLSSFPAEMRSNTSPDQTHDASCPEYHSIIFRR